jgi:hypothetical protein
VTHPRQTWERRSSWWLVVVSYIEEEANLKRFVSWKNVHRQKRERDVCNKSFVFSNS